MARGLLAYLSGEPYRAGTRGFVMVIFFQVMVRPPVASCAKRKTSIPPARGFDGALMVRFPVSTPTMTRSPSAASGVMLAA